MSENWKQRSLNEIKACVSHTSTEFRGRQSRASVSAPWQLGSQAPYVFLFQHSHMVASILEVNSWPKTAARVPAISDTSQVADRRKTSPPRHVSLL